MCSCVRPHGPNHGVWHKEYKGIWRLFFLFSLRKLCCTQDQDPFSSLLAGTGWPTCRSCCPRCKKTVRDAKILHLGAPPPLHVGAPFSPVGQTVYCFTISFPLGSRQERFTSRAATPACRPAIFTGRPDRLLFFSFLLSSSQDGFASRAATPACRPAILTGQLDRLLFYCFYFHWIPGTFYISSHHPCMSARHFHRSARPFTIYLFHFHWVPGRNVLHLEPPPLHVGLPFSPVGQTIYYITISFPFGSRQERFTSRATTPACRPAIFTGRPDRLLFYYFISIGFQAGTFYISSRHPCMSACHFHRSARPFTILLFHFHSVPGRNVLHLEPPPLHVGPPFSPVGQTVYCFTISFPFGSRQERFTSRATTPACRPAIFTGRPDRLLFYYFISIGFFRQERFTSRAATPACRPAIFTGRPDRLLYYYFISIGFQAGTFYISSRHPCMSARHFHRSAGP